MTATEMHVTEPGADAQTARRKRVIVSMGGKGGVGKTNFMSGLAEWYQDQRIPVTLLDLDTENKARGSLTHFFGGQSRRSTCTRRRGWMPSSTIWIPARPSFWPIWAAAPAG